MSVDASSFVLFFITLGLMLAVIFAATVFARWLRTKIIWTPLGHLLVKIGFTMANGTIDDLKQNRRYTVKQSFVDYHGNHFEVGEILTFQKKDYLPYHGGHTMFFAERTLYLQDEEQAEILQGLWTYLEPVRP